MRQTRITDRTPPPRLWPRLHSNAHLGFPATGVGVRRALEKLHRILDGFHLRSCNVEIAELVLAEVLNNIAKHAFAGGPSGIVRLTLCLQGRWLIFTVIDHGRPLPGQKLPRGAEPRIGPEREQLPEGGFGWFLIRHLSDNLCYRRQGNMNLLELRIPLVSQGDCLTGEP
ncbi:MAG: ATP-binding protein [Rhodobacteraceae bacterium]|nr:ATP-binding protein [Paracoccaceae bacterium]